MKYLYLTIVSVLIFCLGCQSKITDLNIKIEIISWWNNPNVDDVIIADIAQDKNIAKVSAMLIVLDDTLREFIYKFEKFQKSWKIIEGPDDMLRSVLNTYIDELRLNKLKANMHTLQLALEDFCISTEGRFPLSLTATVKGVFEDCDGEDANYTVIMKLPPKFHNPFHPDEPAAIDALGPLHQWFFEYSGKVIYFPTKKSKNYARGYIIKGATNKRFIRFTLESF